MGICIRSIRESDFPQLIALFQEFATFQQQADKMSNSVAQMLKEKEYVHGFVAETPEQQIIGYATCFFSYHTWSGKSLYMDDLYVKEAYRKQGIGKALLETVIGLAKEEHCHKVRWQVSHWNKPAQDFYRLMGAQIDATELNCDLILH